MSKRTYCSPHVYDGFILRGEGWGNKGSSMVWVGGSVWGGGGQTIIHVTFLRDMPSSTDLSHVAKSTLYDAQQLYIHINDLCIHRTAQCT